MKKYIFSLALAISINGYCQEFNCTDITRFKLYNIYQQNEGIFRVKKDNIDYISNIISRTKIETLRQICINNWNNYNNYGIQYMFERYIRNYGYIDKNYYIENIQYLEILSYLKFSIQKRLN